MSVKKENRIYIGTAGYSYDDWLGNFYPQFCSAKDYLRFYSSIFKTVELNATFYRVPDKATVENWDKVTPDDFIFTAKFPGAVTHEGDIEERADAAKRFIEVMRALGKKLGVMLLQFPYSFKPDQHGSMLTEILSIMPPDIKVALEVRNRKWLNDKFYDALQKRRICLAMIDHPWMPKRTEFTADFAYFRFLGDRKRIENDFSYVRFDRREEIEWWAKLLEEFSRDWGEVYAYFNNHYTGHSPSSARHMIEIMRLNQSS
jgi:uncharacterized protein YecE (DUF72 family)